MNYNPPPRPEGPPRKDVERESLADAERRRQELISNNAVILTISVSWIIVVAVTIFVARLMVHYLAPADWGWAPLQHIEQINSFVVVVATIAGTMLRSLPFRLK